MKKSISAIVLAILCLNARAQDYYVNDGGVIATPAYGDPKSISPVEWQVWLYNSGNSKGGKSLRWGTISGKSVDSVMSQLKAGQAIEIRCNKFFGTSSGLCTYFNPLGPIAILKKPDISQSQEHQSALERLDGLVSTIREVADNYETAKKIASNDESDEGGEGLKEFLKNLHESIENAAKLHSALENTMDVMLPSLNEQFDQITKNIEVSQQMAGSLNSVPFSAPTDTALEIARGRLREVLRMSAETRYSDQSLNFNDASRYHQFNTIIDSSEKEFVFELPEGRNITLFAASSRDNSGFSCISVEEQSAVPHYLGSCNTSCSSVKLLSVEVTRSVKVKISFFSLPYDRDQNKKVYIIFYAHPE